MTKGPDPTMAGTKNQVKAKAHEVTGKTKEAAGKLTNDKSLRAKGAVDRVKSKVEETVGRLEHAAEDFRQSRPDDKA
jgi:uncharacterized protein YjbJ (UPF0337 family)